MAGLEADPEWVARREAFDRELAERTAALRVTEEPILRDLEAEGIHVDSVWQLYGEREPDDGAVAILIRHLEKGGYPDPVMEGMGRMLGTSAGLKRWDDLVRLYRSAKGRGEKDGLANGLIKCATKSQYSDLVKLISDPSLGKSRMASSSGQCNDSGIVSVLSTLPIEQPSRHRVDAKADLVEVLL